MSGKHIDPSQQNPPDPRGAGTGKTGSSKKTKAPPRRKLRRRILILLVVVLVILTGLGLAWNILIQKPQLPDPTENPILSPEEGPIRLSGDRKSDFYTFLIIGRDTGGGGNTDTILLAAYNVADQEMNVMSIPRDTMVNVSWDIKKINSVYNFSGKGDEGIAALGREISQLVGFIPDFQVVVEWKAVGELVDALGGVHYDVPRDMYYVDPTQDLHIDVKAGYQKLNGEQAMQVVRFREGANGYANGDLGRIETQQGFLKALIKECLQISNVTRIGQLAEVFQENVTTNLTVGNMAWFAQKAIFGGLKIDQVNFYTMPCTGSMVWSRSYNQRVSYVVPKTQELVDMVNRYFNPYRDDLLENELDIMYVNSDGTIGSSTGVLEDKKANSSVRSVGSVAKPVEVDPNNLPKQDLPPLEEPEDTNPSDHEEPNQQPSQGPEEPSDETPDKPETPESPESPGEQPEAPPVTPPPTQEDPSAQQKPTDQSSQGGQSEQNQQSSQDDSGSQTTMTGSPTPSEE